MADKEESDDDEMFTVTRGEWREAMRIAKEDGIHIHKSYAAFQKSLEPKEGDEKPPEDGEPPPKKEEENEPPKKKSIWWGDRE